MPECLTIISVAFLFRAKSLTTCMYTHIHKQMFNAISSWNNNKHTIHVLGKMIQLAFWKRKHFTSTCLFHFSLWLFGNVISEVKSSVLLYQCLSLQLRDKSSVFKRIWNTHISRKILLSQRTVVKLLLKEIGAWVDTDVLVFWIYQVQGLKENSFSLQVWIWASHRPCGLKTATILVYWNTGHRQQPQRKCSLFRRRLEKNGFIWSLSFGLQRMILRMVMSFRVFFQNWSGKRLIISCLDLIAFVWHYINSWAADKMPWLKIGIKWSDKMVCSP